MENSCRYFENTACEYYPCHQREHLNCLFCYCPLYFLGNRCGGNFRFTEKGVKDCSGCQIPHKRENYGHIVETFEKNK